MKQAFAACEETDPKIIFDSYYEFLFDLGRTSIPVAVAMAMHAYALSAAACYPVPRFHPYALVRRRLIRRIRDERALIANTVLCDISDRNKPAIIEKRDGGYLLSGFGRFMSLATIADYAFVQAAGPADGMRALCLVPLKNSDGYRPGRLVFSGSMSATDTRTVTFDRCALDDTYVASAEGDADASTIACYQQAWFQALVPAAYLGGICGVLDRAQVGEDAFTGTDGDLIVLRRALGRARLKLHAARALSGVARDALQGFAKAPKQGIDYAYDCAAQAKVIGFELAEDALGLVRKAAGSACLRDPASQQVLSEVNYARLHPAPDRIIEERFYQHPWPGDRRNVSMSGPATGAS